jgi:hypothetical protein
LPLRAEHACVSRCQWSRNLARHEARPTSLGFKKLPSLAFIISRSHGARLSPHQPPRLIRYALRSLVAMLPRSLPRGSNALRSARGGATWRACGIGAGVGRTTQRRWASEKKEMGKDEDKPFYLQLNESIYERVQKEKAEQIKIQSLQQRTARGQFFATVFGTGPVHLWMAAHTNKSQHVFSPRA